MPSTPTRGPARPAPYVIAGTLLVIAIVMPLMVPTYAFAQPALFGIPFFYWYQMMWVLIDAGLLWICYVVVTREDRRRREVAREQRAAAAVAGSTTGSDGVAE
ncbi:DUF3311 domain-containing protein [Glaciibacter flavus]|uniref:DUF3311 domain-containing protein n=1 Tax=Orlajensenia flava TaxID=2565934 RepID=A0A4S4FWL9_9MICO|nr:DUF3311 domain-containing protein [Glaciibacter flavus]THG34502.1 DUF3311 domain-containing protein [Glaciibacter flavus]